MPYIPKAVVYGINHALVVENPYVNIRVSMAHGMDVRSDINDLDGCFLAAVYYMRDSVKFRSKLYIQNYNKGQHVVSIPYSDPDLVGKLSELIHEVYKAYEDR